MTDIEAGEPVKTPAKRRKKRKPASRVAKPSAPAPADEFAGVTARTCCDGCSEKGCVISGTPFCHHPLKASHPTATPQIVARVMAVKNILKHQQIDAA